VDAGVLADWLDVFWLEAGAGLCSLVAAVLSDGPDVLSISHPAMIATNRIHEYFFIQFPYM
jgi:hypothetical protein